MWAKKQIKDKRNEEKQKKKEKMANTYSIAKNTKIICNKHNDV